MAQRFTTLIDPQDLSDCIEAGETVVLDCRFNLLDVDDGRFQYQAAHIPGAYYADLDHNLSSPIVPGETGRHPLPDPAQFIAFLRQCGIDNDTQIVAYDDAKGSTACRAWWLCKAIGHESVAVLNGDFTGWRKAKLPLSNETPAPGSGSVSQRPALVSIVSADDILQGGHLLLDAREFRRYTGEREKLDPIAGHIPGALFFPFKDNMGNDGRFLDKAVLKDRHEAVVQRSGDRDIAHYCGSGVTAAHNILAAMHAGLPAQALYAGSWSEWITDTTRPIALGEEPGSL